MYFEHNGIQYRIVFRRELVPSSADATAKRMQTQAQLFQEVGKLPNGKMQLQELGRATVRGYFRDPITREAGRKVALGRMTPFIAEELRPLMWKAYLHRKGATK